MLDVNPEYLRRGLREWKVRKLDAIERARIARAEQAALAAAQPAEPIEAQAPVPEVEAEAAKPMIAKTVVKAVASASRSLNRKGTRSDRRAKLRKARA
jgi:hypothetical protein